MATTNFDAVTVAAGALNPNSIEVLNAFLTGAQTTGTLKYQWIVPVAGTITDVRAYLGTAPVGSAFIIDCNKNGTTIFSTQGNRPTIADGGNASTTTVPDVTAVAVGDRLSIDNDQIGSGTAGSNLSVAVTIKRANVS